MKKSVFFSVVLGIVFQLSALEDKKQRLRELIQKSGAKQSIFQKSDFSRIDRMDALSKIQKKDRELKIKSRRQSLIYR